MLDVIIVGAGPAGLSAAIYCSRAGLDCIMLEATMYGGQVMTTSEVENYPAYSKISGFDLAQNMYDQALSLGAKFSFEKVIQVIDDGELKTVLTEENAYVAKAVIIANGAKRRLLGCDGEERLTGSGVSYCAYCDGSFFKNKTACVVGGGNTAIEDAVYLSNICEKVYLIHRRDEYRAQKKLIDVLNSRTNIVQLKNSIITSVNGTEHVESVTLKNVVTAATEELVTDCVFVSIGLVPDNSLFSQVVELDNGGYIISGEDCKTSAPGIFAAGDTRTKALRQIVTACSDGAVAAAGAMEYINSL